MQNLILMAEQSAPQQTQGMGSLFGMDFMVLFNLFIAVYLLYYAIKGTGKVYENDYPKAMKDSHAKFLRKFCWVTGVGMLVLGIFDYMETQKGNANSIFAIVSIVFVLGCVVTYFIVFRVRYKQYLSKPKDVTKK